MVSTRIIAKIMILSFWKIDAFTEEIASGYGRIEGYLILQFVYKIKAKT